MILGLGVFGLDACTNTLPPKKSFNLLSLNGEVTVDGLHVRNIELSESEILAIDSEETFGLDSIILGNFENTLESGSIVVSIPYPLTKYIIRRKEVGQSLNPILVELDYDADLTTYIDYTGKNNVNYTYGVYPFYSDGTTNGQIEGRGVEGGGSLSFWAWTLSDISATPVTQYVFDMEVESGDIIVNKDYKIFNNYTKYPAYRFGQMDYRKGTLSTIPYTVNGTEIEITDTELQSLLIFLNNGSEKILRSPSGDSFTVITYNAKYKYMDKIATSSNTQPYNITFEWFEVGTPP